MAAGKPTYQNLFRDEDPHFLEELRQTHPMPELAAFADEWAADPREWAREQQMRYLSLPWNVPGHEPLIKHLLKAAETKQADELMAVCLVAVDRLVRREPTLRWRYDWVAQSGWEEWTLVNPRNTLLKPPPKREFRNPITGRMRSIPRSQPRDGVLFSYHTRYYLRRRVWRYFRWMGYRRPGEYLVAISHALVLYTNDDLASGENLLDCWGLIHACFHGSEVLERTSSLVNVAPGRSLAELKPAPYFPDLWKSSDAFDVLWFLLQNARSRPIRVWAMELLREHHSDRFSDVPIDELLELFKHEEEEVQQFAAELFRKARGLEALPLETWLSLLELKNPLALSAVCETMIEHVRPERLALSDCLRLTMVEPTPVARLGLGYLRQRTFKTTEDRERLAQAADLRCQAIAADLTAWALPILGSDGNYNRDLVLRFFDSLNQAVRDAAWTWLLDDVNPTQRDAASDPVLWVRLLETPFEDVRLRVIDALEHRNSSGAARPSGDALAPLWTSVLLGVHRGGRQKLKAIRQLTAAIQKHPSRLETLLPVLAVALRSVRRPEMREALSAVATLADSESETLAMLASELPELELNEPPV
ncbi:hypothetical protein [Thalassoroseus pseudoceratinae]|uniref:hypothetical protein n=1 Tax=Thalassoroseus pseudoceratinae TaxID=2713176 RepID=UPI00141D9221|nr:hypothetical protein [Thalassoroseus pseudoceratinae]